MSETSKQVVPTKPAAPSAPHAANVEPKAPALKATHVQIRNNTKQPRMLVMPQPAGVTGVAYGVSPDGMLYPEATSRVPVELWEKAKEQEMVQKLLSLGMIEDRGPFSLTEMGTPEAIKFVKDVTDLRFLRELEKLESENRPNVYAAILKQIEIVTAKAEKSPKKE